MSHSDDQHHKIEFYVHQTSTAAGPKTHLSGFENPTYKWFFTLIRITMVWFSKIVRLTFYKGVLTLFRCKIYKASNRWHFFWIEIILVFTSHNISILNDMLIDRHFQLKVWSNPQICHFQKSCIALISTNKCISLLFRVVLSLVFPK